jgi:hypothetical protein
MINQQKKVAEKNNEPVKMKESQHFPQPHLRDYSLPYTVPL